MLAPRCSLLATPVAAGPRQARLCIGYRGFRKYPNLAAGPGGLQTGPMLTILVMTVIGADRPGLVQMVASCVADHGGNWLESRMCHLGGQFAGILRVEVPAARAEALVRALRELVAKGLQVIIHTESGALPVMTGSIVTLELVGQDHPGILRQVSAVLAAHGVNVEELSSECISAPMGGGNLFQARATALVPPSVNMSTLRADLEKIAADVMVDLKIS